VNHSFAGMKSDKLVGSFVGGAGGSTEFTLWTRNGHLFARCKQPCTPEWQNVSMTAVRKTGKCCELSTQHPWFWHSRFVVSDDGTKLREYNISYKQANNVYKRVLKGCDVLILEKVELGKPLVLEVQPMGTVDTTLTITNTTTVAGQCTTGLQFTLAENHTYVVSESDKHSWSEAQQKSHSVKTSFGLQIKAVVKDVGEGGASFAKEKMDTTVSSSSVSFETAQTFSEQTSTTRTIALNVQYAQPALAGQETVFLLTARRCRVRTPFTALASSFSGKDMVGQRTISGHIESECYFDVRVKTVAKMAADPVIEGYHGHLIACDHLKIAACKSIQEAQAYLQPLYQGYYVAVVSSAANVPCTIEFASSWVRNFGGKHIFFLRNGRNDLLQLLPVSAISPLTSAGSLAADAGVVAACTAAGASTTTVSQWLRNTYPCYYWLVVRSVSHESVSVANAMVWTEAPCNGFLIFGLLNGR